MLKLPNECERDNFYNSIGGFFAGTVTTGFSVSLGVLGITHIIFATPLLLLASFVSLYSLTNIISKLYKYNDPKRKHVSWADPLEQFEPSKQDNSLTRNI